MTRNFRVFALIAVTGFVLLFSTHGKACVVGYQTQSCGGPDFSCSVQINVPVNAWADGGTPTMQPVGCCGGFASTMVGINWDCYVTKSERPGSPDQNPLLQQQLVDIRRELPLYIPNGDGWLVPAPLAGNRTVKPA